MNSSVSSRCQTPSPSTRVAHANIRICVPVPKMSSVTPIAPCTLVWERSGKEHVKKYPRNPRFAGVLGKDKEYDDGYVILPAARETNIFRGRKIAPAPAGSYYWKGRCINVDPFDAYSTQPTRNDPAIAYPSANLDILLSRHNLNRASQHRIMIEGLGFNPTQCGSFCTLMGFCISILEDITLITDINKKHRDGTMTNGD